MFYINNNHINLLTRNVPCPIKLNIEITTYCNLKCIMCRERNIIFEMITNGMFLTPQISKLLVGYSSEIHISFGGSKKKTFESIRQGVDFELLCENIRFLSELKSADIYGITPY